MDPPDQSLACISQAAVVDRKAPIKDWMFLHSVSCSVMLRRRADWRGPRAGPRSSFEWQPPNATGTAAKDFGASDKNTAGMQGLQHLLRTHLASFPALRIVAEGIDQHRRLPCAVTGEWPTKCQHGFARMIRECKG